MDEKTLAALAAYYADAAAYLGAKRNEDDGLDQTHAWRTAPQAPYSLLWYFDGPFQNDLEEGRPKDGAPCSVLDAFFGLGELEIPSEEDYADEWAEERRMLDERFPQDSFPLSERQKRAVRLALHNPISLIKGPAGTGKTEVIMHIVALALERGWTVAMVSANHSAVDNVVQKAQESYQGKKTGADKDKGLDLAYQAAVRLAPLGNAQTRRSSHPFSSEEPFGFASGKGGYEQRYTLREFAFEKGYPFITSTVHSLKKCFRDGLSAKYDLLIMDEASQTSQLVGLLALSCAKRATIVGDEQQLPPVLSDAAKPVLEALWQEHMAEALEGMDRTERERIERIHDIGAPRASFLKSCYEAFDAADTTPERMEDTPVKTVLTEHYRCPEPIIEFCNSRIYGGRLEARTPVRGALPGSRYDERFPLSLIWYEGDYRESAWTALPGSAEVDPDSVVLKPTMRSSSVNEKQLEIMRYEELPRLKALLEKDEDHTLSVCFLAPFRAQVERLQALIAEMLPGVSASQETEGDADASPAWRQATALTIHKSQGQGFDIVYLLPVEDGNWEWPWSQGRELINVAVSRAKRELRVVMSTKLMERGLQEKLAGRHAAVLRPADEADDPLDEQLFVRKLARYMDERCPEDVQAPFGVRQTKLRSIFDEIPYIQSGTGAPRIGPDDEDSSAPQTIASQALRTVAARFGLSLHEEVPLSAISVRGKSLAAQAKRLFGTSAPAHFDFVLADREGSIVLLVEADGGYHRFRSTRRKDRDGQIQRLCNLHCVIADLRKDRLVAELCGGKIAHLGHDSTMGDNRAFFDWARTALGEDTESVPEDIERPEELGEAGVALLRIPTDGSTFLETQELRDRVEGLDELRELPPSIDDWVEACLKPGKKTLVLDAADALPKERDGLSACGKTIVLDDIDAAAADSEGHSLSKVLAAWRTRPEIAERLGDTRTPAMGKKLEAAGLLEQRLCPDGKKRWEPTAQGRAIGISLHIEDAEHAWPVYGSRAQTYLEERLDDILELDT